MDLFKKSILPISSQYSTTPGFAVGGTVTALIAMRKKLKKYQPDSIEGEQLIRQEVEHWTQKISKLSFKERTSIPGLAPKRGRVILGGLVLLDCVMQILKRDSIGVSNAGVFL